MFPLKSHPAITRPQNTANSSAERDSIYAFEHPIGFYQKTRVITALRRLLERNGISLGKYTRVLDLGCGGGFILRMIAEFRGNVDGLTGIDLSRSRLKQAQRLGRGIAYTAGDIRALPFASESFDFVAAFVTFMFMTDDEDLLAAVREARRVLAAGGRFLFFDRLGSGKVSGATRSFNEKSITRLLANEGFRLIDRLTCFKNIFGLTRLSTAYLSSRFPAELLMILERLPFSKPSNIFLLFEKK
jgi:SAM-dependent methyltransferase